MCANAPPRGVWGHAPPLDSRPSEIVSECNFGVIKSLQMLTSKDCYYLRIKPAYMHSRLMRKCCNCAVDISVYRVRVGGASCW